MSLSGPPATGAGAGRRVRRGTFRIAGGGGRGEGQGKDNGEGAKHGESLRQGGCGAS